MIDISRLVSRVQASRIAKELVELGFLVRKGMGRGAHYKKPVNESSQN
jgi:hypothetical protein